MPDDLTPDRQTDKCTTLNAGLGHRSNEVSVEYTLSFIIHQTAQSISLVHGRIVDIDRNMSACRDRPRVGVVIWSWCGS